MMRAKMRLDAAETLENGEKLTMIPIPGEGHPEDMVDTNKFSATCAPYGSITLFVNNPKLAGKLKPGQDYFVDFTEVSAYLG